MFAGNARLAEAIRGAQPAKVEEIWLLDAGGLDALARAGQGVGAGEVARRRAAVTAETLATIVYTSGTTGRSKGCMISHGTLAEAVRAIIAVPGVREQVLAGDACSLFFLPLSHVLARAVMLCLVHAGKRAGFLPDPDQLPGALVTLPADDPACGAPRAGEGRRRGPPAGRSRGPAAAVRGGRGDGGGLEPGLATGGRGRGCGCGTRCLAAWSTLGCARRWAGGWPG